MSDLGLISYYLNIEVKQGKDSTTTCQRTYIAKLLMEQHGRLQAVQSTESLKLTKAAAKVDATLYQSIITGCAT